MRPYPTLAVAGFRRFAAYRAATAAGAVTNTVFGFVKGAIAGAAVAGAGGAIAGYTREGAQTNAWLVQGLLAAMALFGWSEAGRPDPHRGRRDRPRAAGRPAGGVAGAGPGAGGVRAAAARAAAGAGGGADDGPRACGRRAGRRPWRCRASCWGWRSPSRDGS
nr:hypothetical protein [Angustibacter aerolatus]